MKKIIPFPSWSLIEILLRKELNKSSLSKEIIDEIIERMKSFYRKINKKFVFNLLALNTTEKHFVEIEEVIKQLKEQLNDYTNKLLLERLSFEIEQCMLKKSKK